MSTTSRGNQAQDDAKAALERDGWLVEIAKPTHRLRWNRDRNDYDHEMRHDFFGCIDLIAVKSHLVRFIQVTHPSGVRERLTKVRSKIAPELLASPTMTWEVWERRREPMFIMHLVKPDPLRNGDGA